VSDGWVYGVSDHGFVFDCLDNYANFLDMGEIDAEGDSFTNGGILWGLVF